MPPLLFWEDIRDLIKKYLFNLHLLCVCMQVATVCLSVCVCVHIHTRACVYQRTTWEKLVLSFNRVGSGQQVSSPANQSHGSWVRLEIWLCCPGWLGTLPQAPQLTSVS